MVADSGGSTMAAVSLSCAQWGPYRCREHEDGTDITGRRPSRVHVAISPTAADGLDQVHQRFIARILLDMGRRASAEKRLEHVVPLGTLAEEREQPPPGRVPRRPSPSRSTSAPSSSR